METALLQKKINALLTVQDLCAKFSVTPMTIYLWRTRHGLPSIVIKGTVRPTIRFERAEVMRWVKTKGIKVNEQTTK